MAFQFPPSPTVGQQILADNGVLYEWDGRKWIVAAGFKPPPSEFLALAGGALTGPVSGPSATFATANFTGPVTLANDPVANLQPVTLRYLLAHSGVMIGGAAPSNPRDGELWWDDANQQLHIWDAQANQWLIVGGGGGASVTVSGAAPASPSEGDLWWDTGRSNLFLHNGTTWVAAARAISDGVTIVGDGTQANQLRIGAVVVDEVTIVGNGNATPLRVDVIDAGTF